MSGGAATFLVILLMRYSVFRLVAVALATVVVTPLFSCEPAPSRDPQAARDLAEAARPPAGGRSAADRPSLEEQLRRFRAEIPDTPTVLTAGENSRDALVRHFVRAVERADTAALGRMLITRGEYAYLVYPSSPFTRPPYNQPVWLAWFMLNRESGPGLKRLMDRLGGRPVRYLGYECDPTPFVESTNRLWRNCRVRRAPAPGDTLAGRLFGVIIERAGRFKFASYENDF